LIAVEGNGMSRGTGDETYDVVVVGGQLRPSVPAWLQ